MMTPDPGTIKLLFIATYVKYIVLHNEINQYIVLCKLCFQLIVLYNVINQYIVLCKLCFQLIAIININEQLIA